MMTFYNLVCFFFFSSNLNKEKSALLQMKNQMALDLEQLLNHREVFFPFCHKFYHFKIFEVHVGLKLLNPFFMFISDFSHLHLTVCDLALYILLVILYSLWINLDFIFYGVILIPGTPLLVDPLLPCSYLCHWISTLLNNY